jgi:cytoskeletal protein RodZ
MPEDDDREQGERLPAFGRWLARERELRGLDRGEVGRAMKVAPGVVETLESGDGARMPPRAYAVGWLRAYAAAVGLDADEVVLRFEEASGGPAARAGGGRPRAASARVALVVVAVVAAAAAALALLGS